MERADQSPVYLPTAEDYNALVDFRRWGISGPSLVYITVDDVLLFEVWQPIFPNTFTLTLRVLVASGLVVPVEYGPFSPSNTAGTTPFTKAIPGVEGYLVSASVTSNAPQPGQTFARLTVQRGLGSQDTARGLVLLQ